MTKETKDSIAVLSAVGMLCFGATLTAIGFALDPAGEIHDSVLWVLGQSLIYAGGIFGIAYYTKGQVAKQVGELEDRMRQDRDKKESDDPQKEEAE